MEFKGTKDRWYAVKYGWIYVLKYGPHYDSKNLLDFEGAGKEAAYYNAKLATCAPEMLEMLRELKDRFEHFNDNVSVMEIEQLIKKATK